MECLMECSAGCSRFESASVEDCRITDAVSINSHVCTSLVCCSILWHTRCLRALLKCSKKLRSNSTRCEFFLKGDCGGLSIHYTQSSTEPTGEGDN